MVGFLGRDFYLSVSVGNLNLNGEFLDFYSVLDNSESAFLADLLIDFFMFVNKE